jgi:nucleoside transporter
MNTAWQEAVFASQGVRVSVEGYKKSSRSTYQRLVILLFLLGMGPGFWLPGLTNLIKASGWENANDWVGWVFLLFPLASLVSPLTVGAMADQRVAAEKLAVWSCFVSAGFMWAAFWFLQHGWGPWWFFTAFAIHSLVAAPMWTLVTTIALTHLPNPEKDFPIIRLWCTIGWVIAGWLVSLVFHFDGRAEAGYAGVVLRVLLGVALIFAPHTPPRGVARSWRSLLGFDALRLMRERDLRVLMLVSCAVSMPITSFYMHTPEHLHDLSVSMPIFWMSFGQWSEVLAMLVVGWLMIKYRLKTLLMFGLVCCVLRFVWYALAGVTHQVGWMIPGILIHGVCYTLFFIVGQLFLDRRVEVGMRGQMHGLLSLATAGVGTLFGTIGLKLLHKVTVEARQDWATYWLVLAVFTLGCLVWMFFSFSERERTTVD